MERISLQSLIFDFKRFTGRSDESINISFDTKFNIKSLKITKYALKTNDFNLLQLVEIRSFGSNC